MVNREENCGYWGAGPGGNVLDMNYGFNAGTSNNGNVASWTAAGNQAFTRNFAYDALNRINSMTETNGVSESCKPSSSPSSPYTLTWTIDAWGNRNTQSPNQGSCSFNQSVNNQNQLTGTYTYDSAGNLWKDSSGTPTIVYTYDSENRLQSVANSSGTSQYVYNALGQRVSKTTPSGTTYYIFGSDGQVVSERDVNNNWIQTYVKFGGQPVALYKGSATGFFHRVSGFVLANPEFKKDHLGSTRLITLSDRSVYDNMDFLPFGEQIAGGGGSSHKFTGYEYDPETGLDNANARQYSPSFGRFMVPDPLGLGAVDLTNPQSWNSYAYVLNNPLNYVDPTGLTCFEPVDDPYGDGSINYQEVSLNEGDCKKAGYLWLEDNTTITVTGNGGDGGSPAGGCASYYENGVYIGSSCGGSNSGKSAGGGGSSVLAKIKAAYCAALPSGRTLGVSGGTGGTGTVPGAAELVTNFDTGKTTVVVSGGAGFGWNGGAQGSMNAGFLWGDPNQYSSGGMTTAAFSGGVATRNFGAYLGSSSNGLNGGKPNFNVTSAGISWGSSLIQFPTLTVNFTGSKSLLDFGSGPMLNPGDQLMVDLRKACHP